MTQARGSSEWAVPTEGLELGQRSQSEECNVQGGGGGVRRAAVRLPSESSQTDMSLQEILPRELLQACLCLQSRQRDGEASRGT